MQKILDWLELRLGSIDSTGLVQYCHEGQHGRLAQHKPSIACTEGKQRRMPAAEWLCLPGTHSHHCTASTYIDVTYV